MSDDEQNENPHADVTEPTYQQNLVVENLRQLFQATYKASLEHDKRVEKIIAVSGGIVAFVGGASALSGVDLGGNLLSVLSLLAVFGLAVDVFYQSAKVWKPAATKYPTELDVDVLYDDYIAKGVHEAYNQHLSSLVHCANENCDVAEHKAERIDHIMVLVQAQVVAVAAFVFFNMLGW